LSDKPTEDVKKKLLGTVLILLAGIDQELNPGCDDLRRVGRNIGWCTKPQCMCVDRRSLGLESKQIPPEEVRRLAAGLYLPCVILLYQNLTAMVQGLS
jgi:hypothetical protein